MFPACERKAALAHPNAGLPGSSRWDCRRTIMFSPSLKRALAATAAALLLTASFVTAQDNEPALKITRPINAEKQHARSTPTVELDRSSAFQRLRGNESITAQATQDSKAPRQRAAAHQEVSAFARKQQVASAPVIQSFATGGGDRNEIEPNDTIAQGVSLPVNIFGEISFVLDVDYFAFEALAAQQVTTDAFRARRSPSQMLADLAW